MSKKTAALFLNGDPPNVMAMQHAMQENPIFFICTDGAYYYMNSLKINPNVVIGDMDSLSESPVNTEVIFVDDQNTTDFEKALKYLSDEGFEDVLVLGSTGGQNDHFLGNLNAAYKFHERLKITFFDQSQYFFLSQNQQTIQTQPGKIISLFPFPYATGITLTGFQYLLDNEDLSMLDRVGTRNIASNRNPTVHLQSGHLYIFVEY